MPDPVVEAQASATATWPQRFRPEEWSLYKRVLHAARLSGTPFAVGGGLAAMTYAGQWRNTKDLDLYILPADREKMIRLLGDLGFTDYYEKQPYDRKWIYRGFLDDNIVDLIWAMANQRASVDLAWFDGPEVDVDGESFRLLAPEHALWCKMYVLQRDRCDWPDALNLLYGVGEGLNWRSVLRAFDADAPLLAGLLSLFAWLTPRDARKLPIWLWDELRLERPAADHDLEITRERASLLDTRSWFTPVLDQHP